MIKYTFLLLNMLALFVVQLFVAGDVNVKLSAPAQAKAGEEIMVTITIDKGSIAGVGHMKQQLPANFHEASVVEAKGADFKYLPEDNVVKYTWISLPPDQVFSISYKVKVKEDAASGPASLTGKFSYVLNNEKQTFVLADHVIQIGDEYLALTPEGPKTTTEEPADEPTEDPAEEPEETPSEEPVEEPTDVQADVPAETTTEEPADPAKDEPAEEAPAPDAKTNYPVMARRTIVGSPEAGMEFTVEVSIDKNGVGGFARVLETLPPGLTAKALESKNGTFSFIEQKMKIIWDNLPSDETIKISYRVQVDENISGPMDINGSFSYVENDDPKKAVIPVTEIEVKAKEILATTTPDDETDTTTNEPEKQPDTPVEEDPEEPVVASSVPKPEVSVAYKVQICALSRINRTAGYFENKFAIANAVTMEFHEGWRKYIVGKYNQYKDARDYRESVKTSGVENPFVTAYNNGKRITVQEALMVSNQKWIP